jgi:hypothetical protein
MMQIKGMMPEFYLKVCAGNEQAYEFLCGWHHYTHLIDDFVDAPPKNAEESAERLGALLAWAAMLYSSPFWVKNVAALSPIVMSVTNTYIDSVRWEQAIRPQWQKTVADTLRHSGNDMVFAVAAICGGWAHMRQFSLPLRAIAFASHHDVDGNPH